MKNRSAFCFLAGFSLILAACFQPVDIGETFVEKATAHLRVSNESEDDSYILDGFELRNAGGEIEQSWKGLDLKAGKSCDLHTETPGSFTLWYRVKDTWISETAVDRWEAGPVEIALNRSHDFSFKRQDFKVTSQDRDGDGLPDIWETENGFDPADETDGGAVYVSASGLDEPEHGNGTQSRPYKTLAKAVDKASRGLSPAASTVVVLGKLNYQSGNDRNPENPLRSDSVFYLGKTRNPVTIRGEDEDNPGILTVESGANDRRRVLYLDSGANVILQDMTITGGMGSGGGIYASGADLTLGPGTVVKENNKTGDLTGIIGGGIYMERGGLVMGPESSVTVNKASSGGGVRLFASELTMNGGTITFNAATLSAGGLNAENSTITMSMGAEISHNTTGAVGMIFRGTGGGATIGSCNLTMYEGSKIDGNTVYGWAGGIYVGGESTLIMKDGTISGNKCIKLAGNPDNNGWGGGVVLSDRGSFIMEGGAIAGNSAGEYGGGIFLVTVASSFTMSGGKVYGYSENDTNSNTAETTEYYKGHAIYDYRTVLTERAYDKDVTRFPE